MREGHAELGRALVKTARRAIGAVLGESGARSADALAQHAALAENGASFVTLFRQGALRGCIGTLEARRPLEADVRANAVAAAFADPRFPPLRADEFADTSIEISVLSAPEELPAGSERALLDMLRPGIDGLVLEYAGRRATFLPQVWDSLPEPADFLAELKRKAGLPGDFWSPALKVSRYGVTKWREGELRSVEATA